MFSKTSSYLFLILFIVLHAGSAYSWENGGWISDEWRPENEEVTTHIAKLKLEKKGELVTMEAWRQCDSGECYLGRVDAKPSSSNLEIDTLKATYLTEKETISINIYQPNKMFNHIDVGISIHYGDANGRQDFKDSFRFRRQGVDYDTPDTCVFNNNRMWNPDKILWKNAYWECAHYDENGYCTKVQKIESAE